MLRHRGRGEGGEKGWGEGNTPTSELPKGKADYGGGCQMSVLFFRNATRILNEIPSKHLTFMPETHWQGESIWWIIFWTVRHHLFMKMLLASCDSQLTHIAFSHHWWCFICSPLAWRRTSKISSASRDKSFLHNICSSKDESATLCFITLKELVNDH